MTSWNSGEIDVRTVSQPLGTGERYTVSNLALSVGYGRHITDRVVAGGQLHYVNETIWRTSSNMATFSFGATYDLSGTGVTLGASLSHLGTHSRFSGQDLAIQYDPEPDRYGNNSSLPADQLTDDFPVPTLFRVGLSIPRRIDGENHLLFLIDAFHPSDNTESMSLGAEWLWREILAFRTGYQHLFQEDSQVGLTLGAGVGGDLGDTRFDVDYAWGSHEYLESTHRLTLVFEF